MIRNTLIFKATFVALCFIGSLQLSFADNLFNTPAQQTAENSDFYGNATQQHSASYYNELVAQKNKQNYQAMVSKTNTKQNDPQLKAMQEKLLNDNTNLQASPQKKSIKIPAYRTAPTPQATVIYTTPVSHKTTGTATNFNTGSSGNSNNNSGGGLGIQY